MSRHLSRNDAGKVVEFKAGESFFIDLPENRDENWEIAFDKTKFELVNSTWSRQDYYSSSGTRSFELRAIKQCEASISCKLRSSMQNNRIIAALDFYIRATDPYAKPPLPNEQKSTWPLWQRKKPNNWPKLVA